VRGCNPRCPLGPVLGVHAQGLLLGQSSVFRAFILQHNDEVELSCTGPSNWPRRWCRRRCCRCWSRRRCCWCRCTRGVLITLSTLTLRTMGPSTLSTLALRTMDPSTVSTLTLRIMAPSTLSTLALHTMGPSTLGTLILCTKGPSTLSTQLESGRIQACSGDTSLLRSHSSPLQRQLIFLISNSFLSSGSAFHFLLFSFVFRVSYLALNTYSWPL
jgi:hypothetical protein